MGCHDDFKRISDVISLHKPFEKGECMACHSPHAGDFAHNMKKKAGEMCLECHSGMKSALDRTIVKHTPVKNLNCGACHVSHSSSHDNFLIKGQPALCIKCHRQVTAFWSDGVAHEPAIKKCGNCHQPHGSGNTSILKSSAGTLCSGCHETNTQEFNTAHKGIKPGPDSCIGCHDPHGGADKKLLYPVNHKPFHEGNCNPCHQGRS